MTSLVHRVALAALALSAVAATPLPARDAARSVYDEAGVIDPADEATMEAVHRELAGEAGVGLVVVTVPRLVDETIEDLAVRIGQTWGVGTAGRDEGIVIALALADREIHVASGYGAEAYLPDGKVGALLDEHAVPSLRADRFSEGLLRLDRAIADTAAAQHGASISGVAPPAPAPPPAASGGGGAFDLIWIVVVIAVIFLMSRRRGRGGNGLFFLPFWFGGAGHPQGRDGDFNDGPGPFGGFGGGGFGGGGAGRHF